jgi:hypothetical protein
MVLCDLVGQRSVAGGGENWAIATAIALDNSARLRRGSIGHGGSIGTYLADMVVGIDLLAIGQYTGGDVAFIRICVPRRKTGASRLARANAR